MRRARLNALISVLFMVGSALFVLGSVPAFDSAVGGWVDRLTYVVGSVFFTAAAYCRLAQSQSPEMTGVDAQSSTCPRRCGCAEPGGLTP